MRFAWLKNKRVAGFNRSRSVFVTNDACARNHMIKFPLRAVRMIRIRSFASRNAANFNIEWMPLLQIRRLGLATQFLRNLFARADEFSFRRRPSYFSNFVRVDFMHTLPLTSNLTLK